MGVVLSASIENSSSQLFDILGAKNGDKTNSLGCDNMVFDGTGSPAVAFAHRTVTTAKGVNHVVFVVIRGTKIDLGKLEYFDAITDYFSAVGLSDWGAEYIYAKVEDYISECRDKYGDMNPDNTKYLVTGHSLGGACANIVAKK